MQQGAIEWNLMTSEDGFDALQLQIWTADANGLLQFVNKYAAAYFGKSRQQLIGEGWQNVLHSSDLALAVEAWTRAIATGKPYDIDFRLLRASDRTYRWHHAAARRVSGPGGPVWIGSNIDIDAERRAIEVMAAWREKTLGRST